MPFRDPLNKERRFLPLRLDDAPIKGSLAQFLYINWLPMAANGENAKLADETQGGSDKSRLKLKAFKRKQKQGI